MEVRINNGKFEELSFFDNDNKDIFVLNGNEVDITDEKSVNDFISVLNDMKVEADTYAWPFTVFSGFIDSYYNNAIDMIIERVKNAFNESDKCEEPEEYNEVQPEHKANVDELVSEFLNTNPIDPTASISDILRTFAYWIINK